MRIPALVALAVMLQGVAVAQKPTDPEFKNKQAVSVPSSRLKASHQASTAEPAVPRNGTAAARNLDKIERSNNQHLKTSQKPRPGSKATALPATGRKSANKRMKFTYHPPQNSNKGTTSAKAAPTSVGRSRR